MKIQITNANDTVIKPFKGVNLEIARSNTTEYIGKLRNLSKQHKDEIDSDSLTVDEDIGIACEALAGTVLVGFEDFKLSNGDVISYSVNNAANLLINDPDCRKFVLKVSRNAELFEKEVIKDTTEK